MNHRHIKISHNESKHEIYEVFNNTGRKLGVIKQHRDVSDYMYFSKNGSPYTLGILEEIANQLKVWNKPMLDMNEVMGK